MDFLTKRHMQITKISQIISPALSLFSLIFILSQALIKFYEFQNKSHSGILNWCIAASGECRFQPLHVYIIHWLHRPMGHNMNRMVYSLKCVTHVHLLALVSMHIFHKSHSLRSHSLHFEDLEFRTEFCNVQLTTGK